MLVFGASGKILPVGTEADTANIKISFLVDSLVLECRNILSRTYIIDLSRSVAARSHVLAISTESDTADNTVMNKVVNKFHIQDSLDLRIEYSIPVCAFTLLTGGQIVWIPIS